MGKFIWRDTYDVGIEAIDSQHKQLFSLANRVAEATDEKEITHLLMLFYKHIRKHFTAEEEFMRQIEYSEYPNHVQCHNEMLDSLIELSDKVQSRICRPLDIENFVDHWVMEHILTEDLKLVHALQNQTFPDPKPDM
jgi:hemerythrin